MSNSASRIPRENSNQKICLKRLIPLNELQEMQDSFSEVANVSIRTVDLNGRFLTAPSNPSTLCSELFKDIRLREKYCTRCLPAFLGGEGMVDDDLSFECLPGLQSYLVPLKVTLSQTKSLMLGYMVIGPVIFMRRCEQKEYSEIAQSLGLETYTLWNMILELRVFSYKAIHSFLDMIDHLTGHILNLAYTKLAMQKKILKDFSQKISEKETVKALEGSDEFLELFLDLIIQITNGRAGSVMLLDRPKKELVIKAARGLSDDIVRKTTVKLGEGIAGLAAQTKKPFLINDDAVDDVIAERLNKPQLFSSVVVPMKHRDEVYGVLNVSCDRSFPVKFDEATLAVLTKAAGLASMTLERFES